MAVDIVQAKVDMINNHKSPIQDDYIEKYLAEKELNLTATLDAKAAYSDADFVVIAAPTNYDSKTQHFDTSAVEAVIKLVMEYNPNAVMVIKSTIPVGYTASVREKFNSKNIIFSPEFLRESKALYMPRVRLQDEGGRTVQRYVKDYRITQDMAKKLCKLHHTAVGAAYHPQPFDWDALLGLLHKKPPRRSSYEAQLSDSDSLVTTTQIAKEYGCGAKVFNRLLHLHGIQYRANGQWVLYSEHHGKGYTSSLTFRLQRSDGSEVEKLHTAWTQKGRKFLYHTLKRHGVLPLAEQGG